MSEVKLPEINQRGNSRGVDKSNPGLNGQQQYKRSGSFASMGPAKSVFGAKKDRKEWQKTLQIAICLPRDSYLQSLQTEIILQGKWTKCLNFCFFFKRRLKASNAY